MNQHQQQRQGWIRALLKKHQQSGLTRAEFSRREGISVSMLDYYRRQQAKRENEQQPDHAQRLVRVRVNQASKNSARRRMRGTAEGHQLTRRDRSQLIASFTVIRISLKIGECSRVSLIPLLQAELTDTIQQKLEKRVETSVEYHIENERREKLERIMNSSPVPSRKGESRL